MNCSLFTILSLVYDSGMWMDVVWDRGGWRGGTGRWGAVIEACLNKRFVFLSSRFAEV